MTKQNTTIPLIITAGSTYLDIDAYACMVAMAELLRLQGRNAIAYSKAAPNYSVCRFLLSEEQISSELPIDFSEEQADYIIVDVSDPDFLGDSVPLERVIEVYDHHVGFEEYWQSRIGDGAHIEFIGAAATLVYREWKKADLQDKMSRSSALLLIAAILDNTLNLTSGNTTSEDRKVFRELCEKEGIGEDWCAMYFSEVQKNVEADLKNALMKDLKKLDSAHDDQKSILPHRIGQLCVWDAHSIIEKMPEIRQWFDGKDDWMINVIDIKDHCSYFVCDGERYQKEIEKIFGVHFEEGTAKSAVPYLRKEIIKYIFQKQNGGINRW